MPIFPNQSISYHSCLDDRRFEEFIRDLYLQDILEGYFENKFDDVTLLSGIREQGRDCVLHKDGNNVGVIQCKLYCKNLDKPGSIREIVKFCLYSILNPEFIFDKETFEYHFVSSSGFNNIAVLFLKNFTKEILNEINLEKWVKQVIKENKSLCHIDYNQIKNQLCDILYNIKIIPIIGVELDRRLSFEHNKNLEQIYFYVKKVIDNSAIEPIKETLNKLERRTVIFNCEELINEFQHASFALYMCKDYFGNIKDSNIVRKESSEILNWIKSPLQSNSEEMNKNILFVSGPAGCGKTTVLRSLYDSLNKERIPVLGLKSDVFIAKDLEELRLKINLSYPITKSLIEISKKYDKIVLLIDQLDALSQYFSSNREYINTYILLIEYLKEFCNIRIIVSVREYDLNYDFSLQSFKKYKNIQLGELQNQDVESTLFKLKLSKEQLPSNLYSLLKNANNLDVFCRIYNIETNIHEIRTLQDLYIELWKQLSNNRNIDIINLKNLFFKIAENQNDNQRISISTNAIIENFPIEYNFLRSQGIIIEEKNKSLRFFHQSFYDYVFAKKFIENNENIVDYLMTNNQSLKIRSVLKMIYSYLSTVDRKYYLTVTEYILNSRKIRFHIKSLIISLLANIESPFDDEKQIVLTLIKPNIKYYNIFIDNLISTGWTNWLIENKFLNVFFELKLNKKEIFLEKETKLSKFILQNSFYKGYQSSYIRKNQSIYIATSLLKRNLKANSDNILSFLKSIEFDEKKRVVGEILYFNNNWTNQTAYDLFNFTKDTLISYSYYSILENITPINVDFVINEIKNNLYNSIIEYDKIRDDWHEKKKLLYLINETAPEKAIIFLMEIILSSIKSQEYLWTDDDDKFLVPDGLFNSFSVINNKSDYHTDKERIYALLIKWIKNIHISNSAFYNELIMRNFQSKYHSILKIVICVLDVPESVNEDIVISIIERLYNINKISDHGELQGDLHRLIQSWFPTFSNKNKKYVLDLLLSLKDKGKINQWKKDEKLKFYSSYGLTTYLFLQALPLVYVYSNSDAKKIYQELNRKFPEEKPIDHLFGSRYQSGGVGSPIKNDAYTRMTEIQWLNSFSKYSEDKITYNFIGGREQHAQRLKDEIKKRPIDFISLIFKMIADKNIHNAYISNALYAFSESDLSNESLTTIFVSAIKNNRYSDDNLFHITISLNRLFIKGIENETLINFIIDLAVSHRNPKRKNNGDLYSSSINSVRGSSIEALYKLDMNKYGRIVIETIEKVLENANEEILTVILYELAYLNRYNIEKAFSIFLSILENASDELFVCSFNAAQYFANYNFSRLESYFIRAQKIENEDFRKNVSAMLYFAWLNDYLNAESILFEFINNDPKCIGELIYYAITNFYFNEDINGKKPMLILNKYLNMKDEHISHQYDCCFLHYEKANVKFIDLYPFVLKYISSDSYNFKKYYVLDYLLKNSSDYPNECFLIFKKIKFNKFRKESETEYSSTVREKQLNLIMGFCNFFKQNSKNNTKKLEYLDKIFDKLFEDINYKNDIDKVLDLISR